MSTIGIIGKFADLVVEPMDTVLVYDNPELRTSTLIAIVVAILFGVSLFITLVCMLMGNIMKDDKLKSKSKKIAEPLCYYFAFLSCYYLMSGSFADMKGFEIIPFIIPLLSLYCRVGLKKKIISYIVIGCMIAFSVIWTLCV